MTCPMVRVQSSADQIDARIKLRCGRGRTFKITFKIMRHFCVCSAGPYQSAVRIDLYDTNFQFFFEPSAM